MSDFKAKLHQIRLRLGLRPSSAGGAYSAPPDPLAGFKGPTSKGREGKGRGQGGEGEKERGGRRKGKGGMRILLGRGGIGAPAMIDLINES